jgi:hypothetical protein
MAAPSPKEPPHPRAAITAIDSIVDTFAQTFPAAGSGGLSQSGENIADAIRGRNSAVASTKYAENGD